MYGINNKSRCPSAPPKPRKTIDFDSDVEDENGDEDTSIQDDEEEKEKHEADKTGRGNEKGEKASENDKMLEGKPNNTRKRAHNDAATELSGATALSQLSLSD
ncbi:Nn.00g041540.m01.CDS01 [Neocucurbitaria sp. VM-36]